MIIYTPLDIKFNLPRYSEVLDYIKENYIIGIEEHTGYTSCLCPIATPFPVTNWRSATEIFSTSDLSEFKELNFVPGVLEKFPEIIDIINKLPYDVLYGFGFNLHTTELQVHRDQLIDQNPPQLERINILLSPHYKQHSFFLQETLTSQPIYPAILEDYPAYAFNDTAVYHGATPVLDNRVIMTFVGILNKEKHKALIDRSIKKFKEYVIKI